MQRIQDGRYHYIDGIDSDNFENRFFTWPFRVFAIDSKNRLVWIGTSTR